MVIHCFSLVNISTISLDSLHQRVNETDSQE